MTQTRMGPERINIVRIAGFSYSFIIIFAFIPSLILESSLIFDAENVIEAMSQHEKMYRIGTAIEFAMFIVVMTLSWALYILVKPVNKHLALLGFSFRFGEALLGCVVIMLYIMAMMLLNNEASYLSSLSPEQRTALALFFTKLSSNVYHILLTLMGIGGFIYCYLFYIAHMIPKSLSLWGMLTYFTMIVYGMINIIQPSAPSELAYAMIPGAAFEFLVGLWLFFRGVNNSRF